MSEDELLAQPDDAYMNEAQQAFFHDLLLKQRTDCRCTSARRSTTSRPMSP